jgi:hypothetical protein
MNYSYKDRVLHLIWFDPSKNINENKEFISNKQIFEQKNLERLPANQPVSTYVKKPYVPEIKTNNERVDLYNTKKPTPPQRITQVYSNDYKGPFKYEYIRYMGPEKGYYRYQFNGTDYDLAKYNKMYKLDLKSWQRDNSVERWIYNHRHGLMDFAALASLFIPYVGPLISLGIDLKHADMYREEDDKYMAGLYIAFSIIPGGQLINKIPAVKKIGIDTFKKIISKSGKHETMTKEIREVLEQIEQNGKWLYSEASKRLFKESMKAVLLRKDFPTLIRFIWFLSKKYPKTFNISSLTIQIGGVYYTYDKLAEIFGWTEKPADDKKSNEIIKKINENPEIKEKCVNDTIQKMLDLPQEVRDSIYAAEYSKLNK